MGNIVSVKSTQAPDTGVINKVEQVFAPKHYLADRLNKHLRTSYTKFRLSTHKLLVERCRWMEPMLRYEMRKCTFW